MNEMRCEFFCWSKDYDGSHSQKKQKNPCSYSCFPGGYIVKNIHNEAIILNKKQLKNAIITVVHHTAKEKKTGEF